MLDAIYLHIPFCSNKCNYCDFLSFKSDADMRKKYVDYLLKEIDLYPQYTYDTIYFGGGTPSLLNSEDVYRILKKLNISPDAEVTMEINPKTVDFEYLQKIRQYGINRLSIGIQSFNGEYLKTLGRIHNVQEAISTYENARNAGFKNISLDLMFSLPNQTLEDVKKDLEQLINLNPEHFSIYSLIWEEGTPFYTQLQKGILKETDNDLEATMYETIINTARKSGYIHYEISNFAKPNYEARHNSKYWENKEYLGVGLGASGYIQNLRYKNVVQFSQYYDSIDKRRLPILEQEIVSTEDKEQYKYLLGLRLLQKGVIPNSQYLPLCIELEQKGLLLRKDKCFLLSHKGIMFANDVLTEFL